MKNTFYSWRTSKNEDGTFSFVVTKNVSQTQALKNGRYCVDTVAKTQTGFKTRARAKSRAIKWVQYLKATV